MSVACALDPIIWRLTHSSFGGLLIHQRHTAALRMVEDVENTRPKRTQMLDVVAPRNQDDYRNVVCGDILLIGEIAVGREEDVELGGSQSEQLAIPLAGPAHLGNGPRFMAGELAFQAFGKTLVKQYAHGRGAPPWPAPRRRQPALW